MAAKRSRSQGGRRFVVNVHKPNGVIQPRVQKVGPEHFGIVSVDCAKARFKWMLCDFYGKVLIPPTTVEHNRPELDRALAQLKAARQEHELRDLIVAVERTGRYHHIPQRLFADNGDEVRLVHPFTSKQHRTTTDPGNKTDDTDLAAIHRAAVSGCALMQVPVDPIYRELQLLIRQRRDWVRKTSMLCCQSLVDGSYHPPLPTVTVKETVDAYIEHLTTEDRAPKTLVKYRGIFAQFMEFLRTLDITRMTQFTAIHFDKFRAMRKTNHHAKTVYTEGVVIKQLFRWAKRRRLVLENPIEDIKLNKPRLEPKGGPSLHEIDTVLACTKGKFNAMIATLAFTGIRSGEMQRLRIEDVDLDGNWLHVVSRRGGETKTRESRKVPIHPRLREILLSLSRTAHDVVGRHPTSSIGETISHFTGMSRLTSGNLASMI